MKTCLCCSNPLVRCVRRSHVYWFCRHCWQEMPDEYSPSVTDRVAQVAQRSQQTLTTGLQPLFNSPFRVLGEPLL